MKEEKSNSFKEDGRDNFRLPDFLIVGFPRSGSYSLQHYLNQHPDIFCAGEISFFNNKSNYQKGLKWYSKKITNETFYKRIRKKIYHKCFEESYYGEKIIGQRKPGYVCKKIYADRIRKDLPNIKLIFLIRDPVDRSYSEYWHNVRKGEEHREFKQAIDEGDYLNSNYVKKIKHFHQFSNNQKKYIISEEFWNEIIKTVIDTYKFVGASDKIKPIKKRYTHFQSGAPRSRLLQNIVTNSYHIPLISKHFAEIFPILRKGVNIFNLKEYPEMKKETKNYLVDYYKKVNEGLDVMIGKNLSKLWDWWE